MNNQILFLSLVHPDFLPPVYAMSQVLSEQEYKVKIVCFESKAPGEFNAGYNVDIAVVGKHEGSLVERINARKKYRAYLKAYLKENSPKAIFAFCEFSYLEALDLKTNIPVFYIALELVDVSLMGILRSPLSRYRSYQATKRIGEAYLVATPSQERSGWLAGRYGLEEIPETVCNTPYLPFSFRLNEKKQSNLIPDSYSQKVKILHTGGVNSTRSVVELIKGFEKLSSDTCLIITNIGTDEYSNQVKELASSSTRSEDILLLGTISREYLLELQSACDIGVCLMKLSNGFDARMIAPNKVGEYLHSGLLVLGMQTPYFYQFIPYGIISMVASLQPENIAEALTELKNKIKTLNYKSNIERCLKEWYNMRYQMEVGTLLAKLNSI